MKSKFAYGLCCFLALGLVYNGNDLAATSLDSWSNQQSPNSNYQRQPMVEQQQLPNYHELAYEIHQLQNKVARLKSQQKQLRYQEAKASYNQQKLASKYKFYNGGTQPKTAQVVGNQSKKRDNIRSPHSPFGDFVTIGPSIGMPNYYDGSVLIVNEPKINDDYDLLQRSQNERKALRAKGFSGHHYPHLVLSGDIGTQLTYNKPFVGGDSTDIDLSGTQLDTYIEATPWVNGFFNLNYDNGSQSNAPGRIGNSNISIDRSFLVIGNLDKSMFYGSIGQLYPAFGRYGYASNTEPLTQDIGRIKARAINFGIHANKPNRPYASAFIFPGETKTKVASRINNGGFDVGFQFKDKSSLSGDVGAGYIRNIADSQGMSSTGKSCSSASCFAGFDATNQNILAKQVPGVDVHGNVSYKFLTLIAEYVGSSSPFNANDLSYNDKGARPRATDLEGDLSFHLFHLPMVWSLSYSRSYQALALNLPKHRYITSLTMNVAKNVLLTFEYDRDRDYGTNDTANGGNNNSDVGNVAFAGTGKSANTVLSTLTLYF